MKKFDVHVCLVSDQPLPNFIPVLAEEFRPKQVILLTTEKMKGKAETLKNVIENRCRVNTEIIPLHDEYNMQEVAETVFNLQCNLDVSKEQVALNVTGGTKLMALSAYARFRDEKYPVFYFTAKSNQVLILDSEERFTLQPTKMKIEDYLQLYGYPVRKGRSVHRQTQYHVPELRQKLVDGIDSFADSITHLNYIASSANGLDAEIEDADIKDEKIKKDLYHILDLFEKNKFLIIKDKKIQFLSDKAKNYVGGGWFEDYVFETIKKIPGIQDVALNVEIEHEKDNISQQNELDVLVLANNVLHVLEVKTVKFTKNKESKDNKKKMAKDILYKLETLKKLGGLNTKAALVSYRETSNHQEKGNPIRDRAEGAGIMLFERKDLKGLKTLLSKWMGLAAPN